MHAVCVTWIVVICHQVLNVCLHMDMLTLYIQLFPAIASNWINKHVACLYACVINFSQFNYM